MELLRSYSLLVLLLMPPSKNWSVAIWDTKIKGNCIKAAEKDLAVAFCSVFLQSLKNRAEDTKHSGTQTTQTTKNGSSSVCHSLGKVKEIALHRTALWEKQNLSCTWQWLIQKIKSEFYIWYPFQAMALTKGCKTHFLSREQFYTTSCPTQHLC